MFCRKLFFVAATPLNPSLYGNVFSTQAHLQDLFSHFASSKINMSEADITRMFRLAPQLQKLHTLHNVEGFLHLLKKHSCTKSQIANIMRIHLQLMGYAEKILEPKIKLLEDFGFVDRKLAKVLMSNPNILCLSLKNDLHPKMEFLKNVFQSQDMLVKGLLREPRLLNINLEKTPKPSLRFLKGWGFCGAELVSFL
ncbi:hypothetical protein SUGI_0839590 [Cryptomeria japonica]|nr:hypothetical protein SUGI_0839590 [Cryptomeria japonica]